MKSCTACGSTLEQGNENFCPHCGKDISKLQSSQNFILEYSLPVNAKYDEVTKIKIQNPSAVRVSEAALEFYHIMYSNMN